MTTPDPARPADDLAVIRRVVDEARHRLSTLDNYQVMLSRQERVNGTLQPAEDVRLSLRRDPLAVRLEWLDGPSKGREVIYHAGGMMQVHMPGTLVPRISLPPDSPLALKNSRHPISEAGFTTIIEKVAEALQEAEANVTTVDRLTYGGLESPEPGAPTCHAIIRVTPSGETWTVHIDDRTKLPYMVHAEDRAGELLEHYVFRHPKVNTVELASAEAFDPDHRWGKSAGLFGRLARGGDNDPAATSPPR